MHPANERRRYSVTPSRLLGAYTEWSLYNNSPKYSRWAPAMPCLTTAIWRCRKNSSQWLRSFQWKLHSHWLKFLRQRHVAVVRQGPVRFPGCSSLWRDIEIFFRESQGLIHNIPWFYVIWLMYTASCYIGPYYNGASLHCYIGIRNAAFGYV